MKKLKGIMINGEWLGEKVLVNNFFRTLCNISPIIMLEFVKLINKLEYKNEVFTITGFEFPSTDTIHISFENKAYFGIADLVFVLENGNLKLKSSILDIAPMDENNTMTSSAPFELYKSIYPQNNISNNIKETDVKEDLLQNSENSLKEDFVNEKLAEVNGDEKSIIETENIILSEVIENAVSADATANSNEVIENAVRAEVIANTEEVLETSNLTLDAEEIFVDEENESSEIDVNDFKINEKELEDNIIEESEETEEIEENIISDVEKEFDDTNDDVSEAQIVSILQREVMIDSNESQVENDVIAKETTDVVLVSENNNNEITQTIVHELDEQTVKENIKVDEDDFELEVANDLVKENVAVNEDFDLEQDVIISDSFDVAAPINKEGLSENVVKEISNDEIIDELGPENTLNSCDNIDETFNSIMSDELATVEPKKIQYIEDDDEAFSYLTDLYDVPEDVPLSKREKILLAKSEKKSSLTDVFTDKEEQTIITDEEADFRIMGDGSRINAAILDDDSFFAGEKVYIWGDTLYLER